MTANRSNTDYKLPRKWRRGGGQKGLFALLAVARNLLLPTHAQLTAGYGVIVRVVTAESTCVRLKGNTFSGETHMLKVNGIPFENVLSELYKPEAVNAFIQWGIVNDVAVHTIFPDFHDYDLATHRRLIAVLLWNKIHLEQRIQNLLAERTPPPASLVNAEGKPPKCGDTVYFSDDLSTPIGVAKQLSKAPNEVSKSERDAAADAKMMEALKRHWMVIIRDTIHDEFRKEIKEIAERLACKT